MREIIFFLWSVADVIHLTWKLCHSDNVYLLLGKSVQTYPMEVFFLEIV